MMIRYWTDNGACYYHTTGSQYSNYEDLLVAVKEDADNKNIPFRYVQVKCYVAITCNCYPYGINFSSLTTGGITGTKVEQWRIGRRCQTSTQMVFRHWWERLIGECLPTISGGEFNDIVANKCNTNYCCNLFMQVSWHRLPERCMTIHNRQSYYVNFNVYPTFHFSCL